MIIVIIGKAITNSNEAKEKERDRARSQVQMQPREIDREIASEWSS